MDHRFGGGENKMNSHRGLFQSLKNMTQVSFRVSGRLYFCCMKCSLKLFLFLFSLAPAMLFACDVCGAFLGITPFENQNSFGFAHRYRVFNGYEMMNQHSRFFPAGAYRLDPSSPSVLHGGTSSDQSMSKSDFESYKVMELRARYFIHPRIELNAIVPFVSNKQKIEEEETVVNGPGDISFYVGYHLFQKTGNVKIKQRLIAGAGIKFPSGRCNALYADGDRIPVMLQAGTGSTDGFIYLTYKAAKNNWRCGITALGKINGENRYGEQVCASTVNSGFLAYQFRSCSWIVLPQLQVYEEYTNGLREGIVLQEGTGMNMVLAGPGVNVFWKNFGLDIGAQLPLYQQTDKINMKTSGRLMIGLDYNFNSGKYLFK